MNREIEKLLADVEYASVKEGLLKFSEEGRPFALPRFKPQDRSSINQRSADLLGGFPFTNESYPWPTGGVDGLHMQPIIQINLENASKLLGFDYGKGLLQVWGIVGARANSFDVVELGFSSDFNKGVLTRIIPMEQTLGAPSNFFPEFAPWLFDKEGAQESPGLMLIEPSKEMSTGSLISWKLSKEFMYPTPIYERHDVTSLIPDFSEMDEDVDPYDLFEELKAAVIVGLRTPNDVGNCYLGGVRGYGDGRYADPAQGFPVLLSIGGRMNLSVIFDETALIGSNVINSDFGRLARENKLRTVYHWNE